MTEKTLDLSFLLQLSIVAFIELSLHSYVLLLLHIFAILSHRLQLCQLLLLMLERQERLIAPVLEVLRVSHNLEIFRLTHRVHLMHLILQILDSRLQLLVLAHDTLQSMQLKLCLLKQVARHYPFLVQSFRRSEVFLFKFLDPLIQ